jgi:hypothetical protein
MTKDEILIFEKYKNILEEARQTRTDVVGGYAGSGRVTRGDVGDAMDANATMTTKGSIRPPEEEAADKETLYRNRINSDIEEGRYIPLTGDESKLTPKTQDALLKMFSRNEFDNLKEASYPDKPIVTYWNLPQKTNAIISHLKSAKPDRATASALISVLKRFIKILLFGNGSQWQKIYAKSGKFLDASSHKSVLTPQDTLFAKYEPKLKSALIGLNSKPIKLPELGKDKEFVIPNSYEGKRLDSKGDITTVHHFRPPEEGEREGDENAPFNPFRKMGGPNKGEKDYVGPVNARSKDATPENPAKNESPLQRMERQYEELKFERIRRKQKGKNTSLISRQMEKLHSDITKAKLAK